MTLYGRPACHLCDSMLAALHKLRGEYSFEVNIVDIDSELQLVRLYDEFVPVLVADGQELCHYFLDEGAVRAYLAAQCAT